MVQWLGHQVFTTEAQVQSLVRERRSLKSRGMSKNKKGQLREKQRRSFRTSCIYLMPTTQKRGGRKVQSTVHSFTPSLFLASSMPVQGVVITFVTNGWGGWTKEFIGKWTMKVKCWGSGKTMVPHAKTKVARGKILMKRKLLNTYPLKYKQIAQVEMFIGGEICSIQHM